ncbi:hypothetical protein [Halobellus inordinatus]|uniref:hypothetical protein n=1 Tax=Halobellus inordinatus TaxID=1126236 RepID=UPI002114B748|nr:hypothetical protein [Halobellus ramosii]
MTDEDTDPDADRSADPGTSPERDANEATDIDWVDDDERSAGTADERDGTPEPEASPEEERAPLSDLARRVSERRGARDPETASTTQSDSVRGSDASKPDAEGDAAGENHGTGRGESVDADDLFEEMSVGDIEAETLWSSLESDDSAEQVGLGETASSVSEAGTTTRTSSRATEHVVSKTKYCQKCPYLTEPPELACAHDGTEIVAVVDADHFRVRECPMVDE